MANNNPTTVVIFGASGDLTHRKLIPALYNLFVKNRLPPAFNVVGMARTDLTHDAWRADLRAGTEAASDSTFDADAWARFIKLLWYVPGDAAKHSDLEAALHIVREIEATDTANRLYYLSVAPQLYIPIVRNMKTLDLPNEQHGWQRIVIEKPFGTNLATARQLNHELHTAFAEHQIYRIDHFLGKETAQNILFLRFANAIFEPIWNRSYIDNVQISAAETVDVGSRAGYYDSAGVLRDMFQNHLLQILALVTMEPPASLEANRLRNEVAKVLSAIRPIDMFDTVCAQYEGYQDTKGVAPASRTPTYAALRLNIDNWRWQGVPFYLRSGKALARKMTEVTVVFRDPPLLMFNSNGRGHIKSNALTICIQPDEGVHLTFEAKQPDSPREGRSVEMEFRYADTFGECAIPDAYERLILDALQGDAALFTRSDGIEAAWKLIDPIVSGWEDDGPQLASYKRGSWGPREADDLLSGDNGRVWRPGCLRK